MDERLLDKIAEPFNLQLPDYQSMEEMLDDILPEVRGYSEPSFEDEDASLNVVEWVKMSDQPGATKINLWSFEPGSEIRIVSDGELSNKFYSVEGPRRIVIGDGMYRNAILYELAFMDRDFLIVQRHGNQENIRGKKYLVFCREAIGTRLVWHEALTRLVDKYRNSQFPWAGVLVIIAVLLGALVYFR